LLPLHEIIGMILGVDTFYARSIWDVFTILISTFGNEYSVLLTASVEKLAKIVNQQLVNAILKVRRDEINVIPGYDGVYGKLTLNKPNETNSP
jgi:PHP family Zn ribbon phosphoesterase